MEINAVDSILQKIQEAHQMLVRLTSHSTATEEKIPDLPQTPNKNRESRATSGFDIDTHV